MTIETETTAAQLLQELAAKGITVAISPERSNRLRYFPKAAMTDELIARLRSHKANILILLQRSQEPQATSPCDDLPADVADWPEHWRYLYEERAAIMNRDYYGSLSREDADQRAETIVRAAYRVQNRA